MRRHRGRLEGPGLLGLTRGGQEDTGRAAGNKDEGKSKQEEGVQRWRGRVTKETARLR